MKPSLLLLTALAAPAFGQNSIEIVVTGTVNPASTGVTTAPFQGAAAGDAVTYAFDVELPGQLPPGQPAQLYDLDTSSIQLDIGGTTFAAFDEAEDLIVIESPGASDVLTVTARAANGLEAGLYAIDSQGTAFSGVELEGLVGVYSPASFDSLVLSLSDGGGAVVVDVTSLTIGLGELGRSYCGPAVPNSAGTSATLRAIGSPIAAENDLTLIAESLPSNAFGIVIVARNQGFVPNPGGSAGNLCLGGGIGRYNRPGDILSSGSGTSFSYSPDLTNTPTPAGFVSVTAGETWNFQAWFRDQDTGQVTSNFTQGLEIDFQ